MRRLQGRVRPEVIGPHRGWPWNERCPWQASLRVRAAKLVEEVAERGKLKDNSGMLLRAHLLLVLALVSGSCSRGDDAPGPGPRINLDAGTCLPGARRCEGQAIQECMGGSFVPTGRTCDVGAGEACRVGECVTACEAARRDRSYLGCEYWPTTTLNSVNQNDFSFAIVVANPNATNVEVVVELDGVEVEQRTVGANDVLSIGLPWVGEVSSDPNVTPGASVLVRGAAYRVTTTLPVTMYQFNPLDYERRGTFSYSNDASLLLPTHALGTEYRGIAWPSLMLTGDRETLRQDGYYGSPGFIAVVGTEDGTTVRFASKARTQPGPDAHPALAPGDELTVTLDAGDVLQVISNRRFYDDAVCTFNASGGGGCTGGRPNDLTGSAIVADKPIAVFGGHQCAHIPVEFGYCDHMEEQLFPLNTWGNSAIAVSTEPLGTGDFNVFRVVSGAAGNRITFEPAVMPEVTLEDGEMIDVQHRGALRVRGTGRLQLVQYTIGGALGPPMGGTEPLGDPSMGLVVPSDQYRRRYTFLTPSTFTQSYANVIATIGMEPTIDGAPIPAPTPIPGTPFGWSRISIGVGDHTMEGAAPFGVTVHGVAPACSYLYPAGLDLLPLVL